MQYSNVSHLSFGNNIFACGRDFPADLSSIDQLSFRNREEKADDAWRGEELRPSRIEGP